MDLMTLAPGALHETIARSGASVPHSGPKQSFFGLNSLEGQRQAEDDTCWAAIAAALSTYAAKQGVAGITVMKQCDVARSCLKAGTDPICNSPDPARLVCISGCYMNGFNKPAYLEDALAAVGLLEQDDVEVTHEPTKASGIVIDGSPIHRDINIDEIKFMLDRNRAVGLRRYASTAKDGTKYYHFVMIVGYSSGSLLRVFDPADGDPPQEFPFSWLLANKSGISWKYFTKAIPPRQR